MKNKGFAALLSVTLVAGASLAYSLAVLAAAAQYADDAARRELRIRAGSNASACLDAAALIAVKDAFFAGTVRVDDFYCEATLSARSVSGSVGISVRAAAGPGGLAREVSARAERSESIPDF